MEKSNYMDTLERMAVNSWNMRESYSGLPASSRWRIIDFQFFGIYRFLLLHGAETSELAETAEFISDLAKYRGWLEKGVF